MQYVVVTIEEGGADFTIHDRWQDVPIDVNRWFPEGNKDKVQKLLATAKVGDRIALDGCAECFVTNGSPLQGSSWYFESRADEG